MFRTFKNILVKWFCDLTSTIVVDILFKGSFIRLKNSYTNRPSSLKKQMYYSYIKKYGAWIGINTKIGDNLILPHNIYGIFISDNAVLGSNVTIYQQVTIGSNRLQNSKHFGSPTVQDNVLIGAGAKIIGNVEVGKNSRIGANAVVTNNVPDNSIVVQGGGILISRDADMDNTLIPV